MFPELRLRCKLEPVELPGPEGLAETVPIQFGIPVLLSQRLGLVLLGSLSAALAEMRRLAFLSRVRRPEGTAVAQVARPQVVPVAAVRAVRMVPANSAPRVATWLRTMGARAVGVQAAEAQRPVLRDSPITQPAALVELHRTALLVGPAQPAAALAILEERVCTVRAVGAELALLELVRPTDLGVLAVTGSNLMRHTGLAVELVAAAAMIPGLLALVELVVPEVSTVAVARALARLMHQAETVRLGLS